MLKLLAFSVLLFSCQGPSGNSSPDRAGNSKITRTENKEITCEALVENLVLDCSLEAFEVVKAHIRVYG